MRSKSAVSAWVIREDVLEGDFEQKPKDGKAWTEMSGEGSSWRGTVRAEGLRWEHADWVPDTAKWPEGLKPADEGEMQHRWPEA